MSLEQDRHVSEAEQHARDMLKVKELRKQVRKTLLLMKQLRPSE
jgi:hypothetical protein